MGVQMSTTTVPSWRSRLDDAQTLTEAAEVIVVGLAEAADLSAVLSRRALQGRTTYLLELSEGFRCARARFERVVRAATVGTRLVLVGRESEVSAARADAIRLGMIADEIICEVTDGFALDEQGARRVYCAHCRSPFDALVAVGECVPCPTCERSLLVYYHHSPTQAAYLGFQNDVEEAP